MNLIRITPPPIGKPETLDIFRPDEVKLDNGLSIYVINTGDDEVVKFEIIFPTNSHDAANYSLASATHQLSDSGTSEKKAIDIAEGFDFYGAFFQSDAGPDFKSFTLHSISRFFNEALPLLFEILTEATFPDHEVDNWKQRNIQKLAVDSEKVSWLSKTAFNAQLFGLNHPYGFTPTETSYNNIHSSDLREFYKTGYNLNEAVLIISGKITDEILKKVNQIFGNLKFDPSASVRVPVPQAPTMKNKKVRIDKPESVQCGIRVGKQLFGKTHPDFQALSIVNTILGGYFGSRLMSNIREDKGYTYGIGSAVIPFLKSGSFFISTEAGINVRENTLDEIYLELQRLIDEPVPLTELELVKNYLWGEFQRSLDGPFALADRFKSIKLHNLNYDYFKKYFHLLNNFSPEDVMKIASIHLQPATMTEIVAG